MSKRKKIWDNRKVIGEFHRTASTKIVVELTAKEGVKYVNVRTWYKTRTSDNWLPSRDGIIIPIEHPVKKTDGSVEIMKPITEVVNLIKQAVDQSAEFAIEDEANAVWIER